MSIRLPADTPSDRSEVTSIIRHTVKGGHQDDYEKWLREIVPVASKFPGHRGVNVIRPSPGGSSYAVVLHFDSIDNLRAWLDSAERRRLIAKVLPNLVGDDDVEITTGLEYWFTPPSSKQFARPYKQFLVTLSVIYPLTILIPALLNPAFALLTVPLPVYLKQFIVDVVIVTSITYVIMPRYVRLIAKWLYR
jgi:uncharacterized protein